VCSLSAPATHGYCKPLCGAAHLPNAPGLVENSHCCCAKSCRWPSSEAPAGGARAHPGPVVQHEGGGGAGRLVPLNGCARNALRQASAAAARARHKACNPDSARCSAAEAGGSG
jgi:hypothetical protein